MKSQITAIIEGFERGEIPEHVAIANLRELTGREVATDWLRNYWRSESLQDFVDRICAEPIQDCTIIADKEALDLIAEYLQTTSPGRRDRIEAALEFRFGKPSGTVSDLVYQRDLSEPGKILDELKKDARIFL